MTERIRNWTKSYLETAKERNPSFSLRSMAKLLDVPASNLSQFLSGKRNLSPQTLKTIVHGLTNSPEERKSLLEEVLKPKALAKAIDLDEDSTTLTTEEFLALSDWYYYAVRTYLSLPDAKHDTPSIAAALQIPQTQVERALQALFRLKLLRLTSDGRYERTKRHLKTPDSVRVNAAIHGQKTAIHRQHIEHALHSLENHSVEDRDITWVNIPANPEKLDAARELIRKFQDDMLELLEDDQRSTLYRLTVQLCPMGRASRP